MHRSTVRSFASRRRGIAGFVAGVVAASVVTAGGVALAAIPSSSTGKFTGCVHKKTGVLRVINAQRGKECRKREKTITWSAGWTHRGAWSAATAYKVGDIVTDAGSSYLAKARSQGAAPAANPAAWGLLASAGTAGAPGATGPRGPSNAYVARETDGSFQNLPQNTDTTLGVLDVPAGSYVVWAKAILNNNAAAVANVLCRLVGSSEQDDFSDGLRLEVDGNVDREVFSLAIAPVFASAGQLSLICRSSGTAGNAGKVVISAIQVESLSTTVVGA
jgi:hypothetical protein